MAGDQIIQLEIHTLTIAKFQEQLVYRDLGEIKVEENQHLIFLIFLRRKI
jgi:hypothetical protein